MFCRSKKTSYQLVYTYSQLKKTCSRLVYTCSQLKKTCSRLVYTCSQLIKTCPRFGKSTALLDFKWALLLPVSIAMKKLSNNLCIFPNLSRSLYVQFTLLNSFRFPVNKSIFVPLIFFPHDGKKIIRHWTDPV